MAHPKIHRAGRASARLIVLGLLLSAGILLVLQLGRGRETPPAPAAISPQSRVPSPTTPITAQTPPAGSSRPVKAELPPEPPSRPISPADPLPRGATAAGENAEEQAADLARQVLAGGGRSYPALVTAIQLAGFPIRDPDGKVAVEPAGSSQGIAFERYEVNALAELARGRRTVSVPLTSFAEGLASALPQLKDTALANLLLEGIRRHAIDSAGPLLFWSNFIVELGRQAKAHQAYDLLGPVDSAGVQLDAVQMVFIAKRLGGDLYATAHSDSAGRKSVGVSRPVPIYLASYAGPANHAAAGPCTFEDAEGKIVDLAALGVTTGFGELLGYLDSQGVAGAEGMSKLANYANLVLAYVQLVISNLAFDIQFAMEGEPPLVRTQEMRPQVGQTRTIVTTVKMDLSKIEWVNCLRIPLNAMGIDFSVDADGPIEGASVAWTAASGFSDVAIYSGGAEQLVRYVGDPGSRIQNGGAVTAHNAIMDQLTDSNGTARVQVEGVGQRTNLGRQPRPVMKQATAGATVVLKPANLFRDLKDAASTALSGVSGLLTMPAELLYRTRWSYGGWYEFPVQDWKAGNGWAGWLSYTRIENWATGEKGTGQCCGAKPTRYENRSERTETLHYRWEIPSDPDATMITPGFSMATAAYTMSGRFDSALWTFATGWSSCHGRRPPAWRSHQETKVGQADYESEAQVTVGLEADSSLLIHGGGPTERPVGEMVTTQIGNHDDGCNGQDPTDTRTLKGNYRPAMWPGDIRGKADPNTDVLSGTLTKTEKHAGAKTRTTHIWSWELYR